MLLLAGAYLLARRVTEPLLRIFVLILGFVLIRDAMTPLGFWHLGTTEGGLPWLRFTDDGRLLAVFGAGTLLLTLVVVSRARDLRAVVRWGRFTPTSVGLGLAGGGLAAAPALLLFSLVPVDERGGVVPLGLLPALLWFTMAGNLAEEVLFRGFLQGRLEELTGTVRAALLSALLFAACHIYLASTVTDTGWPLLAFTLFEGLICAFLRVRYGVIAAAIAHGLAVFLLASGLP